MQEYVTIAELAALANVNRRYVLAEIGAGRLLAAKIGKQFAITREAADAWLSNSKRGSRRKKAVGGL